MGSIVGRRWRVVTPNPVVPLEGLYGDGQGRLYHDQPAKLASIVSGVMCTGGIGLNVGRWKERNQEEQIVRPRRPRRRRSVEANGPW